MRIFLTIAAAAAVFAAVAGGEEIFGSNALAVVFDRKTGFPVEYRSGKTVLMKAEPSWPSPIAFAEEKPWERPSAFAPVMREGAVAWGEDGELRTTLRAGDWRVTTCVKLYPERMLVRRRFELSWLGPGTGKLERVWFAAGKMRCADGIGGYSLPIRYPTVRRTIRQFRPGRSDGQNYKFGSHSPVIVWGCSGWSALACTDESVPYGDRSRNLVLETREGASVSTLFQSFGWVPQGTVQTIGDHYLMFRHGDDETMLRAIPEWFAHVGQHVPVGRPDSVKDTILYSEHPQSAGQELGWRSGNFNFISGFLPYIRALGCNTVWLRPVEDQSPYVPRDYYKLARGLGSEADFQAYVGRAHALGMKVWRDAVGHGGRNDSERAKAHPEWLYHHEDGSTDSFWCYDMFAPGWLKWFGDFIAHDTAKYDLDGWRMDATSGARCPNWARDIPYGRASFAQDQGALAIMRTIRARAREANPQAVTLAESWFSVAATMADAIYDEWGVALTLMDSLSFGDSTAAAVQDYRRHLHERNLAIVPDAVVLRFNENHDHVNLDSRIGLEPSVAAFAAQAWVDGFPMVRDNAANGYFERCRDILRVKTALEELRRGSSDYLGVSAPDGVFAVLRETSVLASVVLVNFNPIRVTGRIQAPGYPAFETDLAPYGYEVRRVRGPSVADVLGASEPPFVPDLRLRVNRSQRDPYARVFDVDIGGRTVAVRAELREVISNRLYKAGYRLGLEEDGPMRRIVARDLDGSVPKGAKLVVQVPDVLRWFAHTAEGDFAGPLVVICPNDGIVAGNAAAGYGPVDLGVHWSNRFHPFGFTRETAEVGGFVGDRALVFSGFDNGDSVELRNRVGDALGFAVSTSGSQLAFSVKPEAQVTEGRSPGTGDSRLRIVSGGWEFDDGHLKVRIRKSGAVAGIWKREVGGWTRISGIGDIYTTTGSGTMSNVGTTDRLCRQAWAIDAHITFFRGVDGRLTLRFDDGGLRAKQLNQGKMRHPIGFATEFVLGFSNGFVWKNSVSTPRRLEPSDGKLRFGIRQVLYGGERRFALTKCESSGLSVRPTCDDGIIGFTWLDSETEAINPVRDASVRCFVEVK